MTDVLQVVTTLGRKADAQRLAEHLLEDRLAACVQISGPIESTFRWDGRIETAEEWVCTIKTTVERYAGVARVISELNPYDEPEILAFSVQNGSAGYLRWLTEQVAPASE
jgi:periplasmic divalent cation tolerance protein